MNSFIRRLRPVVSLGALSGIARNPSKVPGLLRYLGNFRLYREAERALLGRNLPVRIYPCIGDNRATQSDIGFYFYQDAWAARQIFRERPARHVDIGSTVLLAGILSQFVPTDYVDIRPLEAVLEGLSPIAGSVLDLPYEDESVESVSSMCVIEHIGLGRYGDPINPNGTNEAVAEIARVVRPGGTVTFSVPIGRDLVEFDANRRFSVESAMNLFRGWEVVDSCVLAPGIEPLDVTLDYGERDEVLCLCQRKPVTQGVPRATAGTTPRAR